MSSWYGGRRWEGRSSTTISRSSVRAAESLLSGRIQERGYRGRTEMSRKIYNRLSFMAVSWLDESTLVIQQRLLTLPEAARYLGCALWSIRELIWNGQLPYTRFGRRFQVDVEDLDELVEREKRHGSKPASRPRIRKPMNRGMTSPSNGRQHIA